MTMRSAPMAVVLALVALAGCGDDTRPEPAPQPAPSVESSPGPTYVSGSTVADAEAWVADLLEVGADQIDPDIPAEDMGAVVAWRTAFPDVLGEAQVVEYEQSAPRNGISGFAVVPEDESKPAGPSNPYVLAFAVRDDTGACAGGVLSGYPSPTEQRAVEMESGDRCSGEAAAAAAGY